jgi:hypothetical protein
VSTVVWLCFLVAAMPCMTAWAACCPPGPDTGHEAPHGQHAAHAHHEAGAVASHSHTHDPAQAPEPASGQPGHDCGASAGACCDEALPTLEDRSPKPLPSALEAGLTASTDRILEADTRFRASPERATGPPGHLRLHPRPHLEHCSFLI